MSTTFPNMGLIWPTPGVDVGPTYAQLELTAAGVIDAHTHAPGSGAQVPTAGLNINADLTLNSNNLTGIRTLRLNSQGTTPTGISDLRVVYSKGNELAYRDGTGTEILLTNNGSVAGVSGSITGLSSPASALFSSISGAFSFFKDTSKPGKLNISDISIYEFNNASANAITVKSPASLGSAYTLTLPTGVPAATSSILMDTSGNLSTVPIGQTVIGTISGINQSSPVFQQYYDDSGTISLTAGKWVIFAVLSVTLDNPGSISGTSVPFMYGAIRTGSTVVSGVSLGCSAHVNGVSAAGSCALTAVVNPGATTTYKVSIAWGYTASNPTVGAINLYNSTNSTFYAVRIG